MEKKKDIGLIVLVDTQERGLVAVLQVRGNFNVEKNEQETYVGASQLTAHGGINEGESKIDALLRETREELGEEFANLIQGRTLDLKELNRVENENMSVVNFGLTVAKQDLEKIKIDERTGGSIRLVTKDEIDNIRELKASDRLNSIIDKNEIAMFPDDIGAVKLAFEKLTK